MARKSERFYREVFFAHNGPGPYPCWECKDEVGFLEVIVHHENHDETDHSLENLVPMHRGCHTKHHSIGRGSGKKDSEETKAKKREAGLRRWASVSEDERKAHGQRSTEGRNDDPQETLRKGWVTRRNRNEETECSE